MRIFSIRTFAMPFSLHEIAGPTSKNPWKYAMTEQLSPWKPTQRGTVLQNVTRLARGLSIAQSDQRDKGVITTDTAGSKKMWVWHNRQNWSSLWRADSSSFTCDGIPAGATRIEIWNGQGRVRDVKLQGETMLTLNDLPCDCTLMFLAVGDDEN